MNLIEIVESAELRGRGGAAFPTAVKLRSAVTHRARLIVNACDGEIGAHKDGWVVAQQLDELRAGARAVENLTGRSTIWAAHRGSDTAALLTRAGLDVLEAPVRYVSSEESALASLARGGLARPLTKRGPLSAGFRDSRGAKVAPTLVLNAETVWRLAQLARNGVGWYRGFGTAAEPGPRLVSVTRTDGASVVLETEAGVPVAELLARAGERRALRHLLVGGLGGTFLPNAPQLLFSEASLSRFGARLGPGIIVALDPAVCPLATVERYLTYAAGESAGQCGPCMFGVPEILQRWRRFADGADPAALAQLTRHAGLLNNRGACRFPDAVAGFVTSAANLFADHAARHTSSGCPNQVLVGSHG